MKKMCSKCHLPKNDNDFSNKSACKVCRNTEQKLLSTENNKETVRAGENNKKIINRRIHNSKLNKACIDCASFTIHVSYNTIILTIIKSIKLVI